MNRLGNANIYTLREQKYWRKKYAYGRIIRRLKGVKEGKKYIHWKSKRNKKECTEGSEIRKK